MSRSIPPTPTPGPAQRAPIDAAEEILRRDPSGAYPRSDPRTQWQYRAALTELERRTGRNRVEIARRALARAQAAAAGDGDAAPGANIGHHLLGDGAGTLAAELGARAARPRGLAPALFFPLAIALTAILAAAGAVFVARRAAPGWATALFAVSAVPLAAVYASRIARLLPWRRRPG
ncbi:MAG TPA: hypothetical protein VF771_05195, partial [Longimicrobiaceae bacterium]